ncbi:hypothetical protein HDV00_008838 [Rhizophlyctis rosea]|nr:hypothetical protein HDV00_008838 [Rhizophlyctis rosea]
MLQFRFIHPRPPGVHTMELSVDDNARVGVKCLEHDAETGSWRVVEMEERVVEGLKEIANRTLSVPIVAWKLCTRGLGG